MIRRDKNARPTLDETDLAILRILQTDNTTPQREIGEAVHLSAAAVQRRIKRMRQTGVIQADIAVIDPAAVGHPLTLFVEVALENERIDLVDEVKRKFAAAPEVQQCYYVTGAADFILVITVPSMLAYEKLTRELFFEDSNIKRFQTFIAMNRVKAGLQVPL